VGLLVTDPAARSVRPTKDVDVVVAVASYAEYQVKIGSALRDAGFVECTDEGAPICAWKVDGIRVDVMPTDAAPSIDRVYDNEEVPSLQPLSNHTRAATRPC
jgi:hypothetical protein